jgi:curved DNA-binding protein CbpA
MYTTVSHDYYAILGVSKNATPEEIKEQYKKTY